MENNYFKFTDMDKQCEKIIILDGDTLPGTYFSLTSSKYKQNLNCVLTIKGSTLSQRIIVVIDKMDIACGGDKLLIYDGQRNQGSILNAEDDSQCGSKRYYLRV